MTTPEASLPLVARAAAHADRIAVAAPEGTFRYRDLLGASAVVAARLLAGARDHAETTLSVQHSPPSSDSQAGSSDPGILLRQRRQPTEHDYT